VVDAPEEHRPASRSMQPDPIGPNEKRPLMRIFPTARSLVVATAIAVVPMVGLAAPARADAICSDCVNSQVTQTPFAHLSRLDNADKHRVLLLSSASVSYTTLELDRSSPRTTFRGNGGSLRDGSIALTAYSDTPDHLDVPVTLNLEVKLDGAHERVTGQTDSDMQAPYPQPVLSLIGAVDSQIVHQILPKTVELVAQDHTHDEQGNRKFRDIPRCFFDDDNSWT